MNHRRFREESAMSRDELEQDVDRIYRLATAIATRDGVLLSALRDPEQSRSYLVRAVSEYAESVVTCRPPSYAT